MSHHSFNRRGTPHPWAKVFLEPNKRQTAHLAVNVRSFQLNVGLLLLGGGTNVEAFAILTLVAVQLPAAFNESSMHKTH